MPVKTALVLHPAAPEIRQALLQVAAGRCEFLFRDPSWTQADYHAALERCHIILGEPRNQDFAHCKNLQWMQSPSSGANYYVDGGAFPKTAIYSCMTGQYGSILSEHMLAMTLALCRRLPEYQQLQTAAAWKKLYYDKQLEGATVLILGAGDIGTTLATWMRPMVGRIIGVRRTPRDYPHCYDEMVTLEDLDRVLPQADIIECALPHTAATVGLLNESRLRLMKDDAVLVNGGRGSLIDQEALCKLLGEGKFWCVGLEVTTPEPLPETSPLWRQPRLMITPHVAGNTFGPGSPLDQRIWAYMLENLDRFLTDGNPKNRIDFQTGYRSGE